MMSVGWAIISCGDYADSRGAPGINQAEGGELVAVHSRDRGRAEAFAEKHGAETAYTSVEDVLGDSRIDAVYITSPNHLHVQYTTMAANAGKHVLMEKPLSVNMAEGAEILQVCCIDGTTQDTLKPSGWLQMAPWARSLWLSLRSVRANGAMYIPNPGP